MTQIGASLVMLAVLTVSITESMRPPYIKCQSSEECGKEECCVIGMGRYSIPTCQPRRDRGEECRVSSEPTNTTLSYPDGVTVTLQGVYYVMCPCLGGLTCDDSADTPLCSDPFANNHLYNDYDSLDDSAQRS